MHDDEANHMTGKVIVVTGAGGGFGRLISEMTAARGAMVVAADVDGDAAAQTAKDIEAQIVAVIDTPWGLDISDITVRATGEDYVL